MTDAVTDNAIEIRGLRKVYAASGKSSPNWK